MAFASTTDQSRTYRRLQRRNRAVGVLRLAVPLLGLATFAGLIIQIYIGSLGGRYGIGQITVTPDAIVVEAPEYTGILADGSTYRVWAERAQADIAATDIVSLYDTTVMVERADGLRRSASAGKAVLDALAQTIAIPGLTELADSHGTTGRVMQSTFDWASQTLTSRGEVTIDYSDGTAIHAQGMVYDAVAERWSFTNAVVTMPFTPGENTQ